MSEKLYYVNNEGCDATTYGLVRISDEDFPKFKTFIENLNKNSTYGCMPTIHLYEIDESKIREYTQNSDDYVCDDDILYLDGKLYTLVNKYDWLFKLKQVI